MVLNKQIIEQALESALQETLQNGASEYLRQNGIVEGSMFDTTDDAVQILTVEQAQVEIPDFKDAYPKADENSINNDAQQYIQETYDDSYVQSLIERQDNYDGNLEKAKNEAQLQFENTEPYGNAVGGYWQKAIGSAPDKEIFSLACNFDDNVQSFVEKYAPDFEDDKPDEE